MDFRVLLFSYFAIVGHILPFSNYMHVTTPLISGTAHFHCSLSAATALARYR